jgi:hypothetical protein
MVNMNNINIDIDTLYQLEESCDPADARIAHDLCLENNWAYIDTNNVNLTYRYTWDCIRIGGTYEYKFYRSENHLGLMRSYTHWQYSTTRHVNTRRSYYLRIIAAQ